MEQEPNKPVAAVGAARQTVTGDSLEPGQERQPRAPFMREALPDAAGGCHRIEVSLPLRLARLFTGDSTYWQVRGDGPAASLEEATRMSQFDVDAERITVFEIDDEYLFTHYFDRTDIFEDLSEYYDGETYRFEVPESEFDEVSEVLADAYYELVVVDDPERFCVVKEKYTSHADILRDSVVDWERRGHHFFLLKDELSVREAVERGATRLEDTDFVLGI